MRDRRRIVSIIIIMIGLMVSFAFYTFSNREVTLVFGGFYGSNWEGSDNRSHLIIQNAIKKFQEEYPNVTVEFESGILKKSYSEWLTGSYIIGKEPDVFMVTANDFNLMASKGALWNLSEAIYEDELFSIDAFYDAPLKLGQYEKIQYGLPFESMPTLMCVNITLLESQGIEIPNSEWNWEVFHAICRKVTKDLDKDGEIDQFGVYNYTWKDASYSNGGILYDDKGTENYVNDRDVMNAVNYVYVLNELNDGYQVTAKDFELGKVAFSPITFSEYKTYKTYPWCMEQFTNFEWNCITMPAGPDGGNISEVNSSLIGISQRSKEKKMAWEFMKMLTYNEEIQTQVFSYSDGVSPLRDVTSSEKTDELLNINTKEGDIDTVLLTYVMEKAVATPRFDKYEESLAMLDEGVYEAMNGNKNIRASLTLLHKKINNYLKNFN